MGQFFKRVGIPSFRRKPDSVKSVKMPEWSNVKISVLKN